MLPPCLENAAVTGGVMLFCRKEYLMTYNTVIFDLDGTILNTLWDLADAVNHALRTYGLPEVSDEEVRTFIGNGIRNLMMRSIYGEEFVEEFQDIAIFADSPIHNEDGQCFVQLEDDSWYPVAVPPQTFEDALLEFRSFYRTHLMERTVPYDGIPELLQTLKEKGCRLGVVSNKFDEGVKALCGKFFDFEFVLGQRDGVPGKPEPDMLLEAMKALDADPATTLYVGDSEYDILTARNTGVDCIVCLWGFRRKEFLEQYGPLRFADTAEDILHAVLYLL